jgi:hypothetical protein
VRGRSGSGRWLSGRRTALTPGRRERDSGQGEDCTRAPKQLRAQGMQLVSWERDNGADGVWRTGVR